MKLQRTPPKTHNYVVGPGRGLAGVFVYIRDKIPGPFRKPKEAVTMRVVGSLYEPPLVGILAGQSLNLFNDDPFAHNCFCQHANAHDVNRILNPGTEPLVWQFDEPELFVRFKCDVHPWENGFVCVMEHPFFAVTGPDGRFSFPPGMPDGTFTIEAIHPKAGKLQRKVTFENDEAKPVEFVFQVKDAEPRQTKAKPEKVVAKQEPKDPKMEPKETETEPPPPAAPEAAPPAPNPNSAPVQAAGVVVLSSPTTPTNDAIPLSPPEADNSKTRWLAAAVMMALGIACFRASKS